MSREILPLQRESGVATSGTRSKTMLVRFNHVTSLAVNSFAPDHLQYSHCCNASKTEFRGGTPSPRGIAAGTVGRWFARVARCVSPRPSVWQKYPATASLICPARLKFLYVIVLSGVIPFKKMPGATAETVTACL